MIIQKKIDKENGDSTSQDRSNSDTKLFWLLGAFLSCIMILLPVLIWLFNRDWIVTLSAIVWIGIVFIVISFILIGIGSTNIGMGSGVNLLSGEQGRRAVKAQRKLLLIGMFKSRVNFQSWLLIWGFLYVIPLIFKIPLFPN